MKSLFGLVVPILAFSLSCQNKSNPLEIEHNLLAATAKDRYIQGENIVYMLHNNSSVLIQFSANTCVAAAGFYIERWEAGSWNNAGSYGLEVTVSGGIAIVCEMVPLTLDPSESYNGSADVILAPGVYRLKFIYYCGKYYWDNAIARYLYTAPFAIE